MPEITIVPISIMGYTRNIEFTRQDYEFSHAVPMKSQPVFAASIGRSKIKRPAAMLIYQFADKETAHAHPHLYERLVEANGKWYGVNIACKVLNNLDARIVDFMY